MESKCNGKKPTALHKTQDLRQSGWATPVSEKINYCHNNPVVRNLVQTPGEWRWSSYRWYNGMDGVEIEIDGVEM